MTRQISLFFGARKQTQKRNDCKPLPRMMLIINLLTIVRSQRVTDCRYGMPEVSVPIVTIFTAEYEVTNLNREFLKIFATLLAVGMGVGLYVGQLTREYIYSTCLSRGSSSGIS